MALPVGHDSSTILPSELLQQCFSGFSFRELLPIWGVCSRWRALALNHPNYWANVRLTSDSPGAVCLFLVRISRTSGRPFTVDVSLWLSSAALAADVLPAIACNIARVRSLSLKVNVSHGSDVLDALCAPAPLLQALTLRFNNPSSECAIMLRDDLFAATAPLLRKLDLWNVSLPRGGIRALSAIHTLEVGDGTLATGPYLQNLFALFPHVRRVDFCARHTTFDIAYWDAKNWATLDHVSPTTTMLFEPILPLSVVKHMIGYDLTSAEFRTMLDHLDGALHLDLESSLGSWHLLIHLRERTTPWRARTFVEDPRAWIDVNERPAAAPHELPFARIVTLSIPECFWQLACGLFPKMPSVKELSLLLDEPDPLSQSSMTTPRCLPVPCLERLILRAGLGQPVIAFELLLAFLSHAIPVEVTKLRISMAGVFVKPGTAYGHPLLVFEQCRPEELVAHQYPLAHVLYADQHFTCSFLCRYEYAIVVLAVVVVIPILFAP